MPTELWKLTKSQYVSLYGTPKKNTTLTGSFASHRSAIETALNRGLEVPSEVLKDYPELNQTK